MCIEKDIEKKLMELNKYMKEKYDSEKEQFLDHNQDRRYIEFLDDVRINTIKIALDQILSGNVNEVVPWEIIGIEFAGWKIKEKYGEDVYEKANKEVKRSDGSSYRIFNRDFSRANIKLGHLVHEGVSASPLLDLDIFIKSLEIIGISSYIDYENNVFYYNAVAQKNKTK